MFKKATSILLTLLLLALPNHCVFEDAIVSLKEVILQIEKPTHLNNHIGSTIPHTHENEADSHSHGEPHPIAVANLTSGGLSIAKIAIIPLQGLLFLQEILLRLKTEYIKSSGFSLTSFQETSIDITYLLSSLKIAAQAPPFTSK